MHPFGEVSCEEELHVLGDSYKSFFFHETPFNDRALEESVYLIIGRRGSGKSSLAHYFGFQQRIQRSVLLDVDEPKFYEGALLKISRHAGALQNPDLSIQRMVEVWTLGIWSLLFNRFYDDHRDIADAALVAGKMGGVSIREVLGRLFETLLAKLDPSGELGRSVQDVLQHDAVLRGQQAILDVASRKPIFIAIDTIERYRVDDTPLMVATAALMQASWAFNRQFAARGLHVKTFIPSEVFPSIAEQYSVNTTKYVQDELFLQWRPKALVRLICWRLYRFLEVKYPAEATALAGIRWDEFDDVVTRGWAPHFGARLRNRRGWDEASFAYLLRHTQMRPRQLVILCNQIAKLAMNAREFPRFSGQLITNAIWETESKLATEVINSYEGTYSSVGDIIAALKGLPARFRGNVLDRVAPSTASFWPERRYSPANFRKLVAELGIVGRIRSIHASAKIVEADFEYAIEDRLSLHERDDCVVHPMFYRKLAIDTRPLDASVFPFPDHPDFAELRNGMKPT